MIFASGLAVLLCIASCGSVGAQSVESQFPERYRQAVDAYREGFTTEAVDSVLALDASASQGMQRALRLIDTGLRGEGTDVAWFLRAASMLHFDAALRCRAAANDENARSQLDQARRMVNLSVATAVAADGFIAAGTSPRRSPSRQCCHQPRRPCFSRTRSEAT